MDMSQTIQPNSDQINGDDLLSSAVTVTITGVEAGTAEQPVFIHVKEFPNRTYRPSKSMRRVLVAAWGTNSTTYIGRRLTLFRNPDITFGRDKVGGIQISHASHIDHPISIPLTVSRGKRRAYTLQPLPDDAPTSSTVSVTMTDIKNAASIDELRDLWGKTSDPALRTALQERVATLTHNQQGDNE